MLPNKMGEDEQWDRDEAELDMCCSWLKLGDRRALEVPPTVPHDLWLDFHLRCLAGGRGPPGHGACLDQLGARRPAEGSSDQEPMRVSSSAVSPVHIWQIIPKTLKLVTAIESSVLRE